MAQPLYPPGEGPEHNLEAERQVLGSCILRPEQLRDVDLTTADFFGEKNRILWRTLQHLAAEGVPIDQLHLRDQLAQDGKLAFVTEAYLDDVMDLIPATLPVDILKRCTRQRTLRALAQRLSVAAASGDDAAATEAVREAAAALEQRARRGASVEWRGAHEVFAPLPPVPWRVRGLQICPGRPTIVGGYGASAKTLSVQQLALAVASGTPVWGFFDVPEPMRVRHIDYEQGWHATARRYQRLAYGHHIDPRSLAGRLEVSIFPQVFLTDQNASDHFARIADGWDLLVMDALRGATPGADENDSQMQTFIGNLTRASEQTGCAFVLLHHARKQSKDAGGDEREGLRGSAAIFSEGGAVYMLSAGKNANDPRRVKQTKPPAEAAGRPVEPFLLDVLDVPAPGDPEAGVRVLHKPIPAPDHAGEALSRDLARKAQLYELIKRNPGQSKSAITRIFLANNKGNKTLVFDLLVELHRDRRIRSVPEGQTDLLYAEEHPKHGHINHDT